MRVRAEFPVLPCLATHASLFGVVTLSLRATRCQQNSLKMSRDLSLRTADEELNSLVPVDFELQTAKGEHHTLQLFTKPSGEILYFPDRTLAALFQVNSSTLRGRFNRMAKHSQGRLLFSETAYIFSSSPSSQPQQVLQKPPSFDFVHGMVALNHIDLVNRALRDWISKNFLRLGTTLEDIEHNFQAANLRYHRNGNIFQLEPRLGSSAPRAPNDDAAAILATLGEGPRLGSSRNGSAEDRMDLDVPSQRGPPSPNNAWRSPPPSPYPGFPQFNPSVPFPPMPGMPMQAMPAAPGMPSASWMPQWYPDLRFLNALAQPPPMAPSSLQPSPPLSKKVKSSKASISSLVD